LKTAIPLISNNLNRCGCGYFVIKAVAAIGWFTNHLLCLLKLAKREFVLVMDKEWAVFFKRKEVISALFIQC